MMNQPAQEIEQKEEQRGRRMGGVLKDVEEIREAVDQGEGEDKKEGSSAHLDGGQDEGEDKHGQEDHLKRLDEGDVF
jgi:hypothetical protein